MFMYHQLPPHSRTAMAVAAAVLVHNSRHINSSSLPRHKNNNSPDAMFVDGINTFPLTAVLLRL